MKPRVLRGDCIEMMGQMEPDSIDAIVTDPPYELGFMGKKWDASGVAFDPSTWAAALRVLKPGGHLVAFGAPKNYHRLACAIEDAGFEIRDSIFWCFGSGFPKSHNLHDEWEGWGTALKPAYEPIILARKPLIGTVAENVLAHGTGALNIDACRVATTENLNGGAYSGGGKRAEDATSFYTGTSAGEYAQPTGRWPANLVHDGSEEVLAGFPVTGPSKSGLRGTQQRHDVSSPETARPKAGTNTVRGIDDAGGSAARFFATFRWDDEVCPGAKNDPRARSAANQSALCETPTADGLAETETLGSKSEASLATPGSIGNSSGFTQSLSSAPAEPRASTDTTPTTPSHLRSSGDVNPAIGGSTSSGDEEREGDGSDPVQGTRFLYHPKAGKSDRAGSKHPTVKPIALMRWLVRLITPPGGVVLDPFAGSGTTGQAAMEEGFDAVLIEREAEYVADIERRLEIAPPAQVAMAV